MKRNEGQQSCGPYRRPKARPEELARISAGGPQNTNVITINLLTGQRDGDG
jgi:hypothetical protein